MSSFILVGHATIVRGEGELKIGEGPVRTGVTAVLPRKDVWFNGFTTDLLVSVWIGRDDSTPIGDKVTGGGAAVPIWLDFMQKAHPHTAVRDFPIPPNISFARIEPWSGEPGSIYSSEAIWMAFDGAHVWVVNRAGNTVSKL